MKINCCNKHLVLCNPFEIKVEQNMMTNSSKIIENHLRKKVNCSCNQFRPEIEKSNLLLIIITFKTTQSISVNQRIQNITENTSLKYVSHLSESYGNWLIVNDCNIENGKNCLLHVKKLDTNNVKLACFTLGSHTSKYKIHDFVYNNNIRKNMSKLSQAFTHPERASRNSEKDKLYEMSSKGKQRKNKYEDSSKGKDRQAKYEESKKAKIARKDYEES